MEDVGLFNESYRYAEDLELWYRISKKYSIYSTDEFLINYRWRKSSHSKNAEKMNYFCEKALRNILNFEDVQEIISPVERKYILNNFYVGAFDRYFKAGDSHNLRKSYYRLLRHNFLNVRNQKIFVKYLLSFFGEENLNKLNNRYLDKNLQKSFSNVKDYTQ